MGDILYDCYDEDERHIGIIFAKDCKELLEKSVNVRYVRGMDVLTRRPNWYQVKVTGLYPYRPQNEFHKTESVWHYSDFI